MKPVTFDLFQDVPKNFIGCCYVRSFAEHVWLTTGKKFHRLDGPAMTLFGGELGYYIENLQYKEQEYWQHPLVFEHKLSSILTFDTVLDNP